MTPFTALIREKIVEKPEYGEYWRTIKLANKLLDEPNADPDDELRARWEYLSS